ncbi:MAG: 16S rRNA (cytidine(1402)-2'-O)-methyltransferase, partial [Bdellovibrionales bacterium]
VVARELTKRFEEVLSGTCSEILTGLEERQLKGEIVLMVACDAGGDDWDEEQVSQALYKLIVAEGGSLKESVQDVMSASGWP